MFQIMRNDEKWILYNMKCKKLNELPLAIPMSGLHQKNDAKYNGEIGRDSSALSSF